MSFKSNVLHLNLHPTVVVNTFDGEGFVTCANVAQIIYPQSADEVIPPLTLNT